jgi:hypothetical protein
MQREWEGGRNASKHGWQILRNSRSITHGTVVLIYISGEGVSESIIWRCLKSNSESKPMEKNDRNI